MNENLKSTSQDVDDPTPSPGKGESSITISVAQLGWSAAAVILALFVATYPVLLFLHNAHAVWTDMLFGGLLIFGAVCMNVRIVWRRLRRIFHSSIEPRLVLHDFVLCMWSLLVIAEGALAHDGITALGADAYIYIFTPCVVLFVLSLAFILYDACTVCTLYDAWYDKGRIFTCISLGPIMFAGYNIGYLRIAKSENSEWFTWIIGVLALVVIAVYDKLRWKGERYYYFGNPSLEEFEGGGAKLMRYMLYFALCALGIPLLWYSSIYSVVEFATYHNMPNVVDVCLPYSEKLSPLQASHLRGWGGRLENWADDALKYAAQHGDTRSARAYLRLLDASSQEETIKQLAQEVNMLPLREELVKVINECPPSNPTTRSVIPSTLRLISPDYWSDRVIDKQISFDEPTLLIFLMGVNKALCVETVVKHEAKKCAVYLIQRDGGRASYGEKGATRTLLQVAIEHHNPEMVELLFKYGADPDYAQDGDTPRRMAEKKNWRYVLNMFGPEPSSAQ